MDETPAFPLPSEAPPTVALPSPRVPLTAWFAALQVILVSSVPTEIVIGLALATLTGVPIMDGQQVSLEFFALVSLIDTALVALLIWLFLSLSGETSSGVFIGPRPVRREIVLGLALLPVVFLVASGIILGLRAVAPWMHNVPENPVESYMRSPLEASIFLVVVVLAGGVREELQRAFILHRFEQRLGGAWIGLVLHSLAFGALHLYEGRDLAAAVGVLGFVWGILYIRRRSAVASMVNHAAFDAAQVLQAAFLRSVGG